MSSDNQSFFNQITGKSSDNDLVLPQAQSPEMHDNQELDQILQGSQSELPHEARRTLVYLMKQGVVLADQRPKVFALVCRYVEFIRKHLAEVYLQLVLDEKAGVAYVATMESEFVQADLSEDEDEESQGEFSSLITRRVLTLFDTLILLALRKYYQERESAGEQKIIIDLDKLESFLTPFLPLTEHASLERKKLLARINELKKRKLLSAIRGSDDRFEITPIIRYVVSAHFLESLLGEYTAMLSGDKISTAGAIGNISDDTEMRSILDGE